MDQMQAARALVLVAQTFSFTEAAAIMGTSVAVVSRSIAALERKLGVRLLQRSTRQVTVTAAGLELVPRLQAWLSEADSLFAPSGTLQGTLRVAGVEDGREVESRTLETAGKPARIRLTADRTEMAPDGSSLAYVNVEVTDKEGRVIPNADNQLRFRLEGPATLLATCSGDLKDCVPYTSSERKAWKGRAMAVVKAGREPGTVTLSVSGKGLKKTSVSIRIGE